MTNSFGKRRSDRQRDSEPTDRSPRSDILVDEPDAQGAVAETQTAEVPRSASNNKAVSTRKAVRRRLVDILLPLSGLITIVVVWQLVVVVFKIPTYLVPRPTLIPSTIVETWQELWPATLTTGKEALIGFVIAAVTAVPLALSIATVRVIERIVYPILVVIQTIPKIAVGPLLVVWFGFGLTPKIVLVYLLTFFPILVAATTGFKQLDVRLLYLTRSMGASKLQTTFRLRVPEALPQIFSGLEVGIVFSTTAAIVAEFIGATSGLGYLLLQAQNNLDTPLAFSIIVIISLMGVLFSMTLTGCKWVSMPWTRA